MKNLLAIGLVIIVACSALYWCIGEDEPETKTTVRRVRMSEEDETKTHPPAPSQPRDRKDETTPPAECLLKI